MATAVTCCTDIELAVLAEIKERIITLRAGVNQKSSQGVYAGPVVSVAIFDGSFTRIVPGKWKQACLVNILLTFKNERGEEERRKGINPLVQGIVLLLCEQTLGLNITELLPVSFREVTDDEDYDQGKIVYLIIFSTSFVVTKPEDPTTTDLMTVALNYYLQEPLDTTADSADTVDLPLLPKG
jgi:hypothetical protein